MTTWKLALDTFDSLSWPVVAATAIVLFRKPLQSKMKDLLSVEAPGFKATFQQKAQQLLEDSADLDEPGPAEKPTPLPREKPEVDSPPSRREEQPGGEFAMEPSGRGAGPQTDRSSAEARQQAKLVAELVSSVDMTGSRELATSHPNAAVMLAWSQVERAARASVLLFDGETRPGRDVIAALEMHSKASRRLASDLQRLRNEVTHSRTDVTADAALDYVETCERLCRLLERTVISKMRHPSRLHEYEDIFTALQQLSDDDVPPPRR